MVKSRNLLAGCVGLAAIGGSLVAAKQANIFTAAPVNKPQMPPIESEDVLTFDTPADAFVSPSGAGESATSQSEASSASASASRRSQPQQAQGPAPQAPAVAPKVEVQYIDDPASPEQVVVAAPAAAAPTAPAQPARAGMAVPRPPIAAPVGQTSTTKPTGKTPVVAPRSNAPKATAQDSNDEPDDEPEAAAPAPRVPPTVKVIRIDNPASAPAPERSEEPAPQAAPTVAASASPEPSAVAPTTKAVAATSTTTTVVKTNTSVPVVNVAVKGGTSVYSGAPKPTPVPIGNAGAVVFSVNNGALILDAAIPNSGVQANVSNKSTTAFTVRFVSIRGTGSAAIDATLTGSQVTYKVT